MEGNRFEVHIPLTAAAILSSLNSFKFSQSAVVGCICLQIRPPQVKQRSGVHKAYEVEF